MTVNVNLNGAAAFHFWRVGSCVYRCRICAAATPSNGSKKDFANSLQFWRPVKDHHRMASPATYLAAFPGDPRPCVLRRSFPCGECGADVAHDLGKMTMHMLKKHSGMDLREYYDKHVAADTVLEQKATEKPVADNPTNALPDLKSVAKLAEVAPIPQDTDSDDGKPLMRMRSGRKRKWTRKVVEKKEETRFEEDSDSEPIISDEEERAFTYQSTSKRPCKEGVAQKNTPLPLPGESPVKPPLLKTTGHGTVMSKAGETLEKPKLNWMDGCAFRCLTCGFVAWKRITIRQHVRTVHNMGRSGKTERYEKIYDSVFTCKICKEEFPQELDRVHQHMKGKHKIAPKDYYDKYETGKGNEEMRVTEEPLASKCPICKKTFKRPGNVARHMQSAHNRKGKDNGDSGNDSMGLSGSESNMSDSVGIGQAATETGSSLGDQARVATDAPKSKAVKRVAVPGKTPPTPPILNHKSEWYDGCAFVCAVCAAQSSSKDTMRSHCIKIHHDGLKFTAVSTGLYKCKICSEDVIHEKEALKGHLMTLHNRRLASYFNDFEDTQREARSREKEEKRRLSKEKTMKRMEAEAARTEAEKMHKGPKCPMGMCGMLLDSVEEAVAHVGEVHGIAEDDVMTRRSVMNKVELQLKWRELKISTA